MSMRLIDHGLPFGTGIPFVPAKIDQPDLDPTGVDDQRSRGLRRGAEGAGAGEP